MVFVCVMLASSNESMGSAHSHPPSHNIRSSSDASRGAPPLPRILQCARPNVQVEWGNTLICIVSRAIYATIHPWRAFCVVDHKRSAREMRRAPFLPTSLHRRRHKSQRSKYAASHSSQACCTVDDKSAHYVRRAQLLPHMLASSTTRKFILTRPTLTLSCF